MRFSLIPKSDGRKIVAASVGMAMFNRNANLFFEDDRIFDVEPVERYRVRPVRATPRYYPMVGTVMGLSGAPGAIKIVFGPGTV